MCLSIVMNKNPSLMLNAMLIQYKVEESSKHWVYKAKFEINKRALLRENTVHKGIYLFYRP